MSDSDELDRCITAASRLRRSGMAAINGGTVAALLHGRRSQVDARCWRIARILSAQGYERWSSLAVQEAYRLHRLSDDALLSEDPADKPTRKGSASSR